MPPRNVLNVLRTPSGIPSEMEGVSRSVPGSMGVSKTARDGDFRARRVQRNIGMRSIRQLGVFDPRRYRRSVATPAKRNQWVSAKHPDRWVSVTRLLDRWVSSPRHLGAASERGESCGRCRKRMGVRKKRPQSTAEVGGVRKGVSAQSPRPVCPLAKAAPGASPASTGALGRMRKQEPLDTRPCLRRKHNTLQKLTPECESGPVANRRFAGPGRTAA